MSFAKDSDCQSIRISSNSVFSSVGNQVVRGGNVDFNESDCESIRASDMSLASPLLRGANQLGYSESQCESIRASEISDSSSSFGSSMSGESSPRKKTKIAVKKPIISCFQKKKMEQKLAEVKAYRAQFEDSDSSLESFKAEDDTRSNFSQQICMKPERDPEPFSEGETEED